MTVPVWLHNNLTSTWTIFQPTEASSSSCCTFFLLQISIKWRRMKLFTLGSTMPLCIKILNIICFIQWGTGPYWSKLRFFISWFLLNLITQLTSCNLQWMRDENHKINLIILSGAFLSKQNSWSAVCSMCRSVCWVNQHFRQISAS